MMADDGTRRIINICWKTNRLSEIRSTIKSSWRSNHFLLPSGIAIRRGADHRGNYAELIKRIDLDGEPPERVAQELGSSRNNLTVRLHRTRRYVRAVLEDVYGICSKHGCWNCACG